LKTNFNINSPEIYGDPALLFPYFFPEFKKSQNPQYDYLIIPHYSEDHLFKNSDYKNIVSCKEPWDIIINKILDSKFVISSSLHGIIIAEAYNIPARLLRITNNEPMFKYQDYYYGTQRFDFKYATSIEEAMEMKGEKPFICDLKQLFNACPLEFWPNAQEKHILLFE
jgi:pyruvyltransferase